MSNFRVTAQSQWSSLHRDMTTAALSQARAAEQAASGRKVRTVGDAPTEAATVLRLDEQSSQLAAFARQSTDAKAWLSAADTSLMSASTVVSEALGVVKAASNGALAQPARDALANQLDALSAHLYELASATHLGRPIFGGFGNQAVARDAAGVVSWVGDNGEVLRQVAPTVTVAVNVSGADAFGFTGGDDIFTVLRDAAAAARAGDTAATGATWSRLEARHSDVLTQLHGVGANTNRVESATSRGESVKLALAAARSDLVDVDVPRAAMEMQLAEDGYNAVLAAVSRTARLTSLAELLR